MKVRVAETADELLEPEWGGALSYEVMNQLLRRLLEREPVELEFDDGTRAHLGEIGNGWVGLKRSWVDREAKTKRVGCLVEP